MRDEDRSAFGVRHRSAREAVVASQRGRVLEAMVKAVAEKGYPATVRHQRVVRLVTADERRQHDEWQQVQARQHREPGKKPSVHRNRPG